MEFLLWLQEIRVPAVEFVALVISLLCDKILLISIFCYVFWCVDKKSAYGLAYSFVLSGILVQGIKIFAGIERPFVRNPEIKPYKPALDTATGFSFPSAHTQTATSLLGYAALSFKKNAVKILLFFVILLVMLSRMLLGVHTPCDVFAAFFLTVPVVLLIKLFQKRILEKIPGIFSFAGAVLSVCVLVYTVFVICSGRVSYELAHDCIVVCVCSVTFFVCSFIEMTFIKFDTAATFSGKKNAVSQIVKFVIGIAGLVIIYFLLGLSDNRYVDCFKYVAVFTWVCCLYPLCIRKMGKGSNI